MKGATMKHAFNPASERFGAAIRTHSISPIPDAEPHFFAGDTVVHPSEGICTIQELRRMDLGSALRTYYILKPASEKNSSTVYLPVARGNEILRRLLNREDILTFIAKSREYAGLWIDDSKRRKDSFLQILHEGNYAKIIRMVLEIHQASERRIAEGKKPCAADEAILNEAERLLNQEFAYVLNLSQEETAAFIIRKLNA